MTYSRNNPPKVGQKVKVKTSIRMSSYPNDFLKKGEILLVKSTSQNFVYLEGKPFGFNLSCFESVCTNKDAKTGRFISSNPNKANSAKPAALKNGSLYAVARKSGRVIARLRSVAKVGDKKFGVFTIHKGFPFVIESKKISLAVDNEVSQYLSAE